MVASRPGLGGRSARELLGLAAIIAIAIVLRFVTLPTRGQWDADQGTEMLVLLNFTRHGDWPLLGPSTSIGGVHHGALYYYLLAPAAWLSDSNPVAVTAVIALAGIAAVVVTWWLARSIGGQVAGFVAGLLMAVSTSAVQESTFIWNPNLVPLTSAIALAATWRAWDADRTRPISWVVAFGGAIATAHCHLLGLVLAPAIVGPWILDVRRRGPGPERRRLLLAGVAGLALLVVSLVPLLVHELTAGLSELRAAVAFISGGGEASSIAAPIRFVVIGLRVLAWPLVGLVTNAPAAAVIVATAIVAAVVWRATSGEARERWAARWLGLALAWTVVALTFGASGLATVVPRLPNDQYHAFADPIVFVVAGLAVAALARGFATTADRRPQAVAGAVAAVAIAAAIVGFNLTRQPPAVSPDGGWPAGDAAAQRVITDLAAASTTPVEPLTLYSLPALKSADALAFPLARRGVATAEGDPAAPVAATSPAASSSFVVLCDSLFEEAIGAACGGPAEDALEATVATRLADRFEAAPDRWISVYVAD